MKKLLIICLIIVIAPQYIMSQDTIRWDNDSIYMSPPCLRDDKPYILTNRGEPFMKIHQPLESWMHGCSANGFELFGNMYIANHPTLIYGISVAVQTIHFGYYRNPTSHEGWANGNQDSALWALLIQKEREGSLVSYLRVDSVIWHPRTISRYLRVESNAPVDDSSVQYFPMYELYFDQPVLVRDTFYACIRPSYGWEVYPNDNATNCDEIVYCLMAWHTASLYNQPEPNNDSNAPSIIYVNGLTIPGYKFIRNDFGGFYPILVPPDTDEVPQCMAPANLRMTGQRSGYPFLAWDTTEGGQQEYELQYAPYNSDVWMTRKPTRNPEQVYYPFDPNTYYKARIRSRCYHGCVVHSEWSWSPWSDPILFYIGPTEPDTTSAVADIEALASEVTVAPNPATGHVVVAAPCDIDAVEFFDLQGRMILRREPKAREVRLDVSKWSPGAYTVYVYVHGRKVVRKVTVQ